MKLLIVGVIMVLLPVILYLLNVANLRVRRGDHTYTTYYYTFERRIIPFRFTGRIIDYLFPFVFDIGCILTIICIFYLLVFRKNSITVTDKRVYGKAAWGKRVDLPLDKVSAVAISFGHGIDVSTSSGSIHFKEIKNNKEIHEAISKLLIDRQGNSAESEQNRPIAPVQSNADELKKYKELLECGAISQEEYDDKKKQLLNL